MATVQLQEVNGVLMMPISPEAKSELSLTADSAVQVDINHHQLIVHNGVPQRRHRSKYKLSELLADYDKMPRDAEEDREWLNSPPVGRELL